MYSKARRKAGRARVLGRFGYRPKITAEQFRDARVYAGLTREQAADLVGVSLRTVGHWETGAARPTCAAFKLLRVLRHGDLIDPRWSGYSLIRGKLVSPENHTFEPSDMAWWSLTCRRAKLLSQVAKERDALRAQLSAIVGEAGEGLGLVYYSTRHTPDQETPQKQFPSATCIGAKMGPEWGHERQTQHQEIQSTAAYGSYGGCPAASGRDGDQPQRLLPAGDSELHGLHPAQQSAAGQVTEAGFFNNAPGSRRMAGGTGRQERALSVRKRSKGKTLSPGSLLIGGAA